MCEIGAVARARVYFWRKRGSRAVRRSIREEDGVALEEVEKGRWEGSERWRWARVRGMRMEGRNMIELDLFRRMSSSLGCEFSRLAREARGADGCVAPLKGV